jgi:hypothetical protein
MDSARLAAVGIAARAGSAALGRNRAVHPVSIRRQPHFLASFLPRLVTLARVRWQREPAAARPGGAQR